ncbi:hypothetical protein D9M68_201780 [compost metagenome]
MSCRSLLLALFTLTLGGCASYDYDDHRSHTRYDGGAYGVPYPVYGGSRYYSSNFETRGYHQPRYQQRHDTRYYDQRRYHDNRRYDPAPRYYRGNDGQLYRYQTIKPKRSLAPPKNANKHGVQYYRPAQPVYGAPPRPGYRPGPPPGNYRPRY